MANANKAAEPEVVQAPYDPWKDMVPFYAFKDAGKYSRDIRVLVGGRTFVIQRGTQVMIPRPVYVELQLSEKQKKDAADYILAQEEEYRRNSGVL